MNWKSLLVHIDHRVDAPSRIAYAMRLARDLGAELAGAAVVPPLELPRQLRGNAGARRLLEAELRKSKAGAAALCRDFVVRARDAGLAGATAGVLEGEPVEVLAREARTHDLLVLGSPDADDIGALGGHFVERLMLGAGRPVLVLPAKPGARIPTRALVAWKDAPASARALREALPLLERASSVTVLTVHEDGASASAAEALAFLERRGVKAKAVQARSGDAGAEILRQARAARADLLVMGAYARPRLAELVLGGATRTILERANVPVLYAH